MNRDRSSSASTGSYYATRGAPGRLRRGGRVLLACVLVQGVVVAASAGAYAGLPGARKMLTRAPYLTDLTTSSVQVSWATRTQNRGVVEFGIVGRPLNKTAIASRQGSPITVNGVKEFQNSVQIAGLVPNTTYRYRLNRIGGKPLDLLGRNRAPRFTTLERARGNRPFTFDVMGDWGDTTNSGVNNGSLNQNQARIDALIAKSHARFVLSVGDTAYPGGTQTEYGDLNQTGVNVSAVFGPHYWAVPGQSTPSFAVSGNHGRNGTFLSNWPEATTVAGSGGTYAMTPYPSIDGSTPATYPTSYYAFSTGHVRFYMLDAAWGDSNRGTATGGACGHTCAGYQVDHDAHWTASSPELRWLKRDLATHRGVLKVALFHFPLYSDNASEPGDSYLAGAGNLEGLLQRNRVRLVFNGHAHDYQRNTAVPGGVISYVTGGAGGKVQPVRSISHCSSHDAYAVGWSYTLSRGSACGSALTPTSESQVYNFLQVTVQFIKGGRKAVTIRPINALGQGFDIQTYTFR